VQDPAVESQRGTPERADLRSAWIVSAVSATWTVLSGSAAIVLGATTSSAVLVAFGAVGFVDALGSATLVYHFRHALRHDQLSARLERIAHRTVIVGLFAVGAGAVVLGGVRLASGEATDSTVAGIVLAAVSLVVLVVLSGKKRTIADRVASPALRSDGHLSAIGATQAGVTLVGSVTTAIGWHWADPVAAIVVGLVTIGIGARSVRDEGAAR
jgi:divalent metal cation (Fe/Co/Zn/Cd) transporter